MRLSPHIRHLIGYCLIGGCGVSVDALFFYLLLPILDGRYLLANVFSVTSGIVTNFLLNAFLNFKRTDRLFARFCCFFVTGLLGMGLASLIIYGMVEMLHFDPLVAKMLSIVVVTLFQFLLNNFVSFREFS